MNIGIYQENKTTEVAEMYGIELITIDDCKSLYNEAPEIAERMKDGLQGFALLEAKKMICGDEWNRPLTHKTSQKWKDFLQVLKVSSQNVSYLLDFAGYKESGGTIEKASHYREVKKTLQKEDKAIPLSVDAKYKELGGTALKTAKDIVQSQKVEVEAKENEEDEIVLTRENLLGNSSYPSKEKMQEQYDALIIVGNEMPRAIKRQLTKKGAGLQKCYELIVENTKLSIEDKIKGCQTKSDYEQVMGVDQKKPPKNLTKVTNQNKELREQIVEQSKKIAELERLIDADKWIESLRDCFFRVHDFSRDIERARNSNEALFNSKLTPTLKRALKLLDLSYSEIVTLEQVKKAYKLKAKETHPDAGGANDLFVSIKEAYEIAKKSIK